MSLGKGVLKSSLEHQTILGTRIDATSYQDACDRLQEWIREKRSCYVVAANVHVVMTGYWNRRYQAVINQAALVTPDGMPLVWGLRLLGIKQATRVYGPDLMLAWCERAAQYQLPLFLYGGTEALLETLIPILQNRYPNLAIAGYYAPPFRALTSAEEEEIREKIQSSGASLVLVGLGCPKQEEWMARQQGKLAVVMIGVGAAFNFHSGMVSQAPRWMMNRGLEWLYRLGAEPRRLWRRYLFHNPAFVLLFGWQWLTSQLKR
jgi:N-acetylglucosaminyldiphosphoundecaprenol N-acetyl-beta-D-mannosaminyltransferase